jgi:hypothetical protein
MKDSSVRKSGRIAAGNGVNNAGRLKEGGRKAEGDGSREDRREEREAQGNLAESDWDRVSEATLRQ